MKMTESKILNSLRNTIDSKLEREPMNYASNTTFDYLSDNNTFVYYIHRKCKMEAFDTTMIHSAKVKFCSIVIRDSKNSVYLVFRFLDKLAYFQLLPNYDYNTNPYGKTDRYFMEFGDYYYIPISDLVVFEEFENNIK